MDKFILGPEIIDDSGGPERDGYLVKRAFLQRIADYINDLIDENELLKTTIASSIDTIAYQWYANTEILVNAGIAVGLDGTIHTLADDVIISFEGATVSTKYYIWIGINAVSGVLDIEYGTSGSMAPSALNAASAKCLPYYVNTNAIGNVEPFWYCFGNDEDDVIFEWVDGDSFNVLAGGKFTDHTGKEYRVNEDIVVDFDDLSADVVAGEEVLTMYYVWAGADQNTGALKIVLSDTYTHAPIELSRGRCLRPVIRNDASGNILEFVCDQRYYWYAVSTYGSSGDCYVGVFSNNTAWTTLDFSEFVPFGQRKIMFKPWQTSASSAWVYVRPVWGSAFYGWAKLDYSAVTSSERTFPVDNNRQLSFKTSAAVAFHINIYAFELDPHSWRHML